MAYLSLARIGLAAGPAFWPNSLTLWNSVKEVVKDGLAEDRRDFCPQSLPCLEVKKSGSVDPVQMLIFKSCQLHGSVSSLA